MKQMSVREALKSRSFPDGYHSRQIGMDWAHGLKGTSISSSACPQSRTLTLPTKLLMPPNPVDPSLRHFRKPRDHRLCVNGRAMAREAPIRGSQPSRIVEGASAPRNPPDIEAVPLALLDRALQVADGGPYCRGRSLHGVDVLNRDGLPFIFVYADHKETGTFRRCTEFGGIPNVRTEYGVIVAHASQRVSKQIPSARIGQPTNVLHNEKGRLHLGD